MPVSHLGLTVSRIPSAISFYLAALQPLGYRYIGQQGDSIGLGVTDADFFLCQKLNGARVSPNHIAFAADNRLAVRDCYTAALNAGARPSGAPSYRNNDCSCFNAAVEDEDGNTIEFIFRESCESHEKPTSSQLTRAETCQGGVSRSTVNDDVQSMASKASRTKSRAQTALDVASTASKSVQKSTAPAPGITRSRTEPITSIYNNGGKAIVGTLLGAAAGAAVAYAMVQSERDSARDEVVFASSPRSKASSLKDHRPRTNYEGSIASRKSYRPETVKSSHLQSGGMRAIEAPEYDAEDIQDVISRYNSSRRPELQRSRTYDAIEYPPRSNASGRSDRFSTNRAATMPIEMPHYLIEGPKTAAASRHTSRRGSMESSLKRHDSGVSMHSHHSRRRSSFDSGRRSSMSKASTEKPGRRGSLYESAANVPLPPSKSQSYVSAANMPLPSSRATSYMSAAQIPVPLSQTNGGYTEEESDGLGDTDTVVPEDSISCIDFSTKRKKSKSSSKSSRHSSKRSEANSERTVRPAKPTGSKHSAQTLPVRSKDDYYSSRGAKRSTLTYA